jgi:hypothetical protein
LRDKRVPDEMLPDDLRAKPVEATESLDEIKKRYKQMRFVGAKPEELSRIADKYVSLEQGQGGYGLALDDTVRGLARGVPIVGGALDEISAGADSLFGGDYQESLDYQRARDRYSAKSHPWLNAGLELTGGIAGTLAGARALGIPYGAGSTLPLPVRALAGGAVTAPITAADSFVRAEGGAEARGESAKLGGVLGAGLGTVAPVVASAVSSGAQRLAGWLTSEAMLRRLGISRQAANVLLKQLQTDDTVSGTGAARIRQSGPDGMIADAGPAASNLLDTALERSGPGSTEARAAIENRVTRANTNMVETMDANFGKPVGVETRKAALRESTKEPRGELYGRAYGSEIDRTDPRSLELWQMLSSGQIPKHAVDYANAILKLEGKAPLNYTTGKNGKVEFKDFPDVRQWDHITEGLNTVGYAGEGAGAMGGINRVERGYRALSGEIRDRLKGLVPAYKDALELGGDVIRENKATEFGARILSPGTTREEVFNTLARMEKAERRAAVQGIRDFVDNQTAKVKAMASDPNQDARELREMLGLLTSRASRDKLAAAIGPDATAKFSAQVTRAARSMELRASVSRGSRTFGRTATNAAVQAQQGSVISLAMRGDVPGALKRVMQSLTKTTPEDDLARLDKLYGEIADTLTKVRGRAAEKYLLQLQRALKLRTGNARFGKAVGTLATDAYLGSTIRPASEATLPARQ